FNSTIVGRCPAMPKSVPGHQRAYGPCHIPVRSKPENGHRGVLREDVVRPTHPTLRRAQSLVAARDRSFQSLPCFCQFIRICRFCGVFLPSVNSCSPTKLKRTMAVGPTTRTVGSLYSSDVHL